MPELPEVETVRQTLRHLVISRTISAVEVRDARIIAGDPEEFCAALQNQTIQDIDRIGKYLIFILDDCCFVSHLRMEGKYFYEKEDEEIRKHTHVIFHFAGQTRLSYNDTRKFGRMSLTGFDYREKEPFNELGKEPFDMTGKELYDLSRHHHTTIKTFLLDQHMIAGLGNIYANEVLFLSAVHPLTCADALPLSGYERIIEYAREVLNKAIALGGTTVSTFSSNGIHGRFDVMLSVHGKEHQPCPRCGHPILRKTINGRSAYYCPNCQKRYYRRRKT